MSERDPQIIADVSKEITTVYRDGVDGPILYTTTESEHFNTDNGNGNYFTRPVEDDELKIQLLEQDAEKQKREINSLVKVPIRTRLAGYALTASGVYAAKELIHNAFTQHNLVGYGLLAFTGVGITEVVTAVRKHDSEVHVKFYEEKYNAQQYHIRRLRNKEALTESRVAAGRDRGHLDTGL